MQYLKSIMNIFLVVSMAFLFAPLAFAEPQQKVLNLRDGSNVVGVILNDKFSDYVVQTASQGQVRINKSQVVSVEEIKVKPGSIQVADIEAIVKDPELTQLVMDPAFLKAVQSKDFTALQSNPRLVKEMNNPKVKEFIEKVKSINSEEAKGAVKRK